jgi:hypothetical protein
VLISEAPLKACLTYESKKGLKFIGAMPMTVNCQTKGKQRRSGEWLRRAMEGERRIR